MTEKEQNMADVDTKRTQVVNQLKAVAALCENLGTVSAQMAKIYAMGKSDEMLDMVGIRSASQMEIIGDMLNGMDAVADGDEWMTPVFNLSHEMFPDAVRRMGSFGPARINIVARAAAIAERECILAGNPSLGAKIDDLISKLMDDA